MPDRVTGPKGPNQFPPPDANPSISKKLERSRTKVAKLDKFVSSGEMPRGASKKQRNYKPGAIGESLLHIAQKALAHLRQGRR